MYLASDSLNSFYKLLARATRKESTGTNRLINHKAPNDVQIGLLESVANKYNVGSPVRRRDHHLSYTQTIVIHLF
jgi:hypothetical protein